MVGMGVLMLVLSLIALVFSLRGTVEKHPLMLRILIYAIPIPYIANQLGWLVAEVGRQPWIVYGILKTSDAVSTSISVGQVLVSLVGFTLLYGLLGILDIFLLFKYARKGPDDGHSGIINSVGREA
jgi:cytochrome d ubiquinol oxidase subunit I